MKEINLHESGSGDDVIRPLPHAVGCEKSVLSTILQDPNEYLALAIEDGITEAHFYLPAHSNLFSELTARFQQGIEIEFVGLVQSLMDAGKLEKCGGASSIADLLSYSPTPGYFMNHCQEIKSKMILRSMIRTCNSTVAAIYDDPKPAIEILDEAERAILAIRESGQKEEDTSNGAILRQISEELEKQINGEIEPVSGLRTGFKDLDNKTGGLKKGEVFVVAARPSMGKTSFMMNMVENICIDLKIPCLVFSAEMGKKAILQRLAYSRARFALSSILRGYKPNKAELARIQLAMKSIMDSPLYIIDKAAPTINEIRAKARRYKRKYGIEEIAIDYMQLCKSTSKQAQGSREREIAEISAGLKQIAKDLDVHVTVLAQLNRDSEKRTGKAKGRPQMSDLRESGSIEQDADLIGFLTRPEYYAIDEAEKIKLDGRAELILAKNRNGEVGSIPLTFIKNLVRFEDGEPWEEPETYTNKGNKCGF